MCVSVSCTADHCLQIIAIHIDNGFMRHEESAKVVQALEHIGLKIHLIDGPEQNNTHTNSRKTNNTDVIRDDGVQYLLCCVDLPLFSCLFFFLQLVNVSTMLVR